MKKILPIILILIILTGFFNSAVTAEAQNLISCRVIVILGNPLANPPIPDQSRDIQLTPAACAARGGVPSGTTATLPPGITVSGTKITQPQPSSNGCWISWNFSFSLSDCILFLLAKLAMGILGIFALILGLSGMILNFVLNYTVVQMSENINGVNGVGGIPGINTAWQVLRDLMNMAFIFVLVYEAIILIIGVGSRERVKKFIINVVIASLLVNFSLFFTKVLIDASNIVTIGFYNQILDTGAPVTGPDGRPALIGLSVPFMRALHVTQFYSGETSSAALGNDGNMIIVGLAGSVLFLIVSFVFFAVACLFVIRYVVLLFLLMLSPVAYMGAALPFFKGYADMWWDSLKGQLLFAPVYMLMTWVILTLMTTDGFITSGDWGALLLKTGGAGQSSIGLVFNFVVIIGLVIGSLILAKSTATQGSKLIGQASGKFTAMAGTAVIGGAAWTGRKTVGAFGASQANNAELQERANKGGLRGAWARTALYTARTARDATFDARNASVPTSVIGDVTRGTIGRTGIGKKFGLDNATLGNIAVGAPIAATAGVGAGGTKGYRDEKAAGDKERRDRETANATELKLAQTKQKVLDGKNAVASTPTTPNPAGDLAISEMEKALATLSAKETETLVASNRELLNSQNFANAISVKQLEALNNSDQFSETEKATLKGKRFGEIDIASDPTALAKYAAASAAATAAAAGGPPLTTTQREDIERVDKARARVKGLKDDELEMIDPAKLTDTHFVSQLRAGQVDTINNSAKFTTTQRNKLKETRKAPVLAALALPTGTPPEIAAAKAATETAIKGLGPKEIASLDMSELKKPMMIESYTKETLKRMAPEMSPTGIQELRAAIEARIIAAPPAAGTTLFKLNEWFTNPNTSSDFS